MDASQRTRAGRSVEISDPEQILWPNDKLTKSDALNYYREMAPVLLPYLKDRPVTTHVFPEGIEGSSFFRRDVPDKAPDWLRSVDYRPASGTGTTRLILIDAAAGLLWLANQGDIEFHLWLCRAQSLLEPDLAIFDLDPGDEASFDDVLRAARLLREALADVGLVGYPKTSGRQGLHVMLSLAPGHAFEQVRAWVRTIAEGLAAANSDLIAVAHRGTHTGSHVTVDHAQNAIARNLAAPYTLRGEPGAPVSAPLSWDEVEEGRLAPDDFTIKTMPGRLREKGDLFVGVLEHDQRLPS